MTTAPMDIAAERLAEALSSVVVATGFSSAGVLVTDDRSILEGDDGDAGEDETDAAHQTVAALFSGAPQAIRQLSGGARSHYVVEGVFDLELASWGGKPAAFADHRALLNAVLDQLAILPEDDPTLGMTCERLTLVDMEDDDFEPGGLKRRVSFVIRLRAGDRFGRTPLRQD